MLDTPTHDATPETMRAALEAPRRAGGVDLRQKFLLWELTGS